MDFPCAIDCEVVAAAEEIKRNVGCWGKGFDCKGYSSPKIFVRICCGDFDCHGVLYSDFVAVSDVLCFLEIVVSLGLAILGKAEKTIGLDELIAEPNAIVIHGNLSVFSHVEQFHWYLIVETQNGSIFVYCSNEEAVLSQLSHLKTFNRLLLIQQNHLQVVFRVDPYNKEIATFAFGISHNSLQNASH